MNADLYVKILEEARVPFILDAFPDGYCRFMQDNGPKHTLKRAQEYFMTRRINWWATPPESPECNLIENLWHELKEFLRCEVKPHSKQELIDGILQFWKTVDVLKCTKYIRHLRKVLPRIIELNGDATGY